MSVAISPELETFAREHELVGLTMPSLRSVLERRPGYSVRKAQDFLRFQQRIRNNFV